MIQNKLFLLFTSSLLLIGLALIPNQYPIPSKGINQDDPLSNTVIFNTSKGKETWKITDHHFSITKKFGSNFINLWVQAEQVISKLPFEEDPCYGPTIEVAGISNIEISKLKDALINIPNYDDVEEDFGENGRYYSNFYQCSHESVEDAKIEILDQHQDVYTLKLTLHIDDIFEYKASKIPVEVYVKAKLHDELKGFWVSQ